MVLFVFLFLIVYCFLTVFRVSNCVDDFVFGAMSVWFRCFPLVDVLNKMIRFISLRRSSDLKSNRIKGLILKVTRPKGQKNKFTCAGDMLVP